MDRWEVLVRYRFIEIIALWEGRLTTKHLTEAFGIGRQQASKDINNYKRSVGPDNLVYDKFLRGYVPSVTFAPVVTRGEAEEYLQLLSRNSELQQTFGQLPINTDSVEVLSPPVRQVPASVLRPLIQAAKDRRRIEVDYVSLNNPDREGRIIVPHTLVWTGLRWHIRGWCEKNNGYRDFVLSRFRGEAELMDESDHGIEDDVTWAETVNAVFTPDPRLTPDQQAVVAHDHHMENGQLCINVRGLLLPYLLQLLNLGNGEVMEDPKAQQVILANRSELQRWLFSK